MDVCSAVYPPGSALALWTSIALTPSPVPPSLYPHSPPSQTSVLSLPLCLAFESGSSASYPYSIAPSLHYWFPARAT